MNKRNYYIGAATLIIILLAWYFYPTSPKTEVTETRPVEVSKPSPPKKVVRVPPKVVPVKKDLPENIQDIRSKQKLHLAATYTAMKAMYADKNRYSTDLMYMGYGVDSEIDFKIGFIKPYYPAELETTEHSYEDPERMTNDLCIEGESGTITESANAINLSDYEHLCKKGCTADENGFEIMVVSPLRNGKHDVWVINEKKEIVQVQDGTKI